MGGKDSASFSYFRELCVQGFLEARKPENSQVACHDKLVMTTALVVTALVRREPAPHIPNPTPPNPNRDARHGRHPFSGEGSNSLRPDLCGGWQRVLLLVEMMSSGLGGQLNMPCVCNQSTSALVASIKDL